MKTEELREQGLTQEQIDYVMAENGKDIKKLQETNAALSTARDTLQTQLDTAQNTLAGFEGVDLEKIQTDLAAYKKAAEDAKKEAEQKLAARDYEDALRAALEDVKFTSEAARRAVTDAVRGAALKLVDGKLMGLNDLLAHIREKDASAFVDEAQAGAEEKRARFTAPLGGGGDGKEQKRDQISMKDAIAARLKSQMEKII